MMGSLASEEDYYDPMTGLPTGGTRPVERPIDPRSFSSEWAREAAQNPGPYEPNVGMFPPVKVEKPAEEDRPNPLVPFSAYRSKPQKGDAVGAIAAEQLISTGPFGMGLSAAIGRGLPLLRSAGGGALMSAEPDEAEAAKRIKTPKGTAPSGFASDIVHGAKSLEARPVAPWQDLREATVSPIAPNAPQMGAVFAPNIVTRANPDAGDIDKVMAAAREYGRKGWPTAEREVFKTTPEAYAETTALVPQISIKDRLPGPLPGEALPNKGRADIIVENRDKIADRIAERLYPMVKAGDERLKFYHTGPVIRGLEQYGGLSIEGANKFMRNWAGQGAATSPRTQTPPNLRNSSYLTYLRESGNPLTPERYAAEGNVPGFPMMGMHVDLADKFARGAENAFTNPKPTTFRENWSGNLRDVTADTHNIRSTLYEMDQVSPGSLPREWFSSDKAFAKYKSDGFRAVGAGDISDTLGDKTVKGIRRQSEYLPMSDPWYRAAEKVGVAPAEAQSGGWFSYGDITGLQSPPKTIPNLLNDQVDATAKALNVSPEKILEWWSGSKIPLASIGGAGVIGGLAAQNRYREGQGPL